MPIICQYSQDPLRSAMNASQAAFGRLEDEANILNAHMAMLLEALDISGASSELDTRADAWERHRRQIGESISKGRSELTTIVQMLEELITALESALR